MCLVISLFLLVKVRMYACSSDVRPSVRSCTGRVLDDVESYIASLGLSCAANQVNLM